MSRHPSRFSPVSHHAYRATSLPLIFQYAESHSKPPPLLYHIQQQQEMGGCACERVCACDSHSLSSEIGLSGGLCLNSTAFVGSHYFWQIEITKLLNKHPIQSFAYITVMEREKCINKAKWSASTKLYSLSFSLIPSSFFCFFCISFILYFFFLNFLLSAFLSFFLFITATDLICEFLHILCHGLISSERWTHQMTDKDYRFSKIVCTRNLSY